MVLIAAMGGFMMRDCLMADSRKSSRHQQETTDVSKSSHGSMCDVIAGLDAAPAGRVVVRLCT
jgi:hypothetical protein